MTCIRGRFFGGDDDEQLEIYDKTFNLKIIERDNASFFKYLNQAMEFKSMRIGWLRKVMTAYGSDRIQSNNKDFKVL